jgi:DNA-binding NtrC family response regulator
VFGTPGIDWFANGFTGQQMDKGVTSISPEAEEILMRYSRPRNARELANTIKRG